MTLPTLLKPPNLEMPQHQAAPHRAPVPAPPAMPALASFVAPFGASFRAIGARALALLARLRHPAATAEPPSAARSISHNAERRAQNAIAWLLALLDTMAGQLTYIRSGTKNRRPAPAPRPLSNQPKPEKPQAQHQAARIAAQRRRIRDSFARDPISLIARRICTRLGIAANDPDYPADLAALTETPKQWLGRILDTRMEIILAQAGRTFATALPCDILLATYGPAWNAAPRRRPKPPF